MGVRDDGKADRRHVRGATRAEVARKVRALERERESGTARPVGQRWTVASWLDYWITNIAAPPHIAENTHAGYRVDVRKHIVPGLGAHRLEKLTPEHVERLYAKLRRGGLSPGGVHHVHRTLRAALNEAVRRSHLTRNPVLFAKSPPLDEEEVEPYDVEEIQRLLEVAASGATAPGGRSHWRLVCGRARRSGSAGRTSTWTSACSASAARGCARGTRTAVTAPAASSRLPAADECPPSYREVKSKAGRRMIGLPPQLVALLRAHRAEQERDRNGGAPLACRGLGVRQPDWSAADPEHRLPRVEAAVEGGRAARIPAA